MAGLSFNPRMLGNMWLHI